MVSLKLYGYVLLNIFISVTCFNLKLKFLHFSPRYKPKFDKEQIQKIKDLIASDKVVIFSKTTCPYSKLAKKIFKQLSQHFTAVELNKCSQCDKMLEILESMTGSKTVPQVFVDGDYLGGATEIQALYNSGELENILYKPKE